MKIEINPALVSLLMSKGITIIPADSIHIDYNIGIVRHSDHHISVANHRHTIINNVRHNIKTRRYYSLEEIPSYLLSVGHTNIVITHLNNYRCISAQVASLFEMTKSKTITYTSW